MVLVRTNAAAVQPTKNRFLDLFVSADRNRDMVISDKERNAFLDGLKKRSNKGAKADPRALLQFIPKNTVLNINLVASLAAFLARIGIGEAVGETILGGALRVVGGPEVLMAGLIMWGTPKAFYAINHKRFSGGGISLQDYMQMVNQSEHKTVFDKNDQAAAANKRYLRVFAQEGNYGAINALAQAKNDPSNAIFLKTMEIKALKSDAEGLMGLDGYALRALEILKSYGNLEAINYLTNRHLRDFPPARHK